MQKLLYIKLSNMRALNHATVSKIGCPPASPELAMAGRPLVSCIMSLAGVSKEKRYSWTTKTGAISNLGGVYGMCQMCRP